VQARKATRRVLVRRVFAHADRPGVSAATKATLRAWPPAIEKASQASTSKPRSMSS
jgi:hypothetical protein